MNRFYFQAVILFLYCFFFGCVSGAKQKEPHSNAVLFDSGGDGEIRTRGGKALTDFESAPL